MSLGTTLSRLTGFVRVAAMTAALGVTATRLADTYNVANTTPNIIYELALGGVLSSVFLPVFVEWMQTHGREAAWDVAHRVMTLTLVALSIIALIGIVVAPWIIDLYTKGSPDPAAQALATFFLRWFLPQIVFYGLGAVAAGLLNAHRRFAAPMFAPVLNNVVAIGTFATFALLPGPEPASPQNITDPQRYTLAIGTTLGVVAMTLALWPSLRRTGWRWRFAFGWRHEAVVRIVHLAKWTMVYVMVNQVGYLLVIVLAYRFGSGGYTAYFVAFTVFQLPHAIFSVSIFTALLPSMSGRWAAGDVDGYRDHLSQAIRTTAAIIVPAALGYLVLALPISRLLFQYGNTDADDAQLIASVLQPFALGLFGFSLFQLLLRAFYAMQDTRTPALINVVSVGINIGLNLLFVLVWGLGVQGLALGYAASYTAASALALLVIRRRLGRMDAGRILDAIVRIGAAGIASGAAAWLAARTLAGVVQLTTVVGRAEQVLTAVVAGVLAFLISALILRIREVDTVMRTVQRRLRR